MHVAVARQVAADEALRIGLVDEVVPNDRLHERAFALAAGEVAPAPASGGGDPAVVEAPQPDAVAAETEVAETLEPDLQLPSFEALEPEIERLRKEVERCKNAARDHREEALTAEAEHKREVQRLEGEVERIRVGIENIDGQRRGLFTEEYTPTGRTPLSAMEITARQTDLANRIGSPFARVLNELVQPSPKQEKRFWNKYRDYSKKMVALENRTAELIEEYAANYDTISQEQALRMAKEAADIDADRLVRLQRVMRSLQATLNARQMVRFLQVELKFDALVDAGLALAIPISE